MIEAYFNQSQPVSKVANLLQRSRQTIYKVYHFLKSGGSSMSYYKQYKKNKRNCGRHPIMLSDEQQEYIQKKVAQGWAPDVFIGRAEFPIACSVRTLYRRSIRDRKTDYTQFDHEFGHLEGDTIVGGKHKSAVITLVERLSKVIITLKPEGRQAKDIENRLNQWFRCVPKHLFKSITFDCGKEFSNWKNISNVNDISIYFADPGTPSQRGLNKNSNGLLRKDGLYKAMDFNGVSETFIQSVASKRNHIPRKSLNYRTPSWRKPHAMH